MRFVLFFALFYSLVAINAQEIVDPQLLEINQQDPIDHSENVDNYQLADILDAAHLENASISIDILQKPVDSAQSYGKPPSPTSFEIKAVVSKCVRKNKLCDDHLEYSRFKTKRRKAESGEEKPRTSPLEMCNKKITVTLKVLNEGETNCEVQYVVLDKALDSTTGKKGKLLNPYVMKIRQTPVFQTHGLFYEGSVNARASEKVLNKDVEGCNSESSNPTCASTKFTPDEVPYSQGFCCGCSPKEPIAYPINEENHEKDIRSALRWETNKFNLPGYNKNDYGRNGIDGKSDDIKGSDLPDDVINYPNIGERLMSRNGHFRRIQKRGWQDCDNTYTPPNLDQSYHQSAHCLEFADTWYSVYNLGAPTMDHSLTIQIYEKISLGHGKILWREITEGMPILLGTSKRLYFSRKGNLMARYSWDGSSRMEFSLDHKSRKLLIPESEVRDPDTPRPKQSGDDSGEYLVLHANSIDLSGRSCNKAGVGFEAFAKQPHRCERERNSCLANQPQQLWQQDRKAEESGEKGRHFLKYYGSLPDNPIRKICCNGTAADNCAKTLYMHYTKCFTHTIRVDFVAESNAVLQLDALATITEVYTEFLDARKITLTAKIFNSGLMSGVFYIGLHACPTQLPASFSNGVSSKPALIPPQQQHIFALDIYCDIRPNDFFCSLEVITGGGELTAVRRVRFRKLDRCVCAWHCRCSCLVSDYGLKCGPLEIGHYHAAGFQGGMSVPTQIVHYSPYDDTLSISWHIVLYCCLTLLYMGLIKALLGTCLTPISQWGLENMVDLPKKLNRYYEPHLRDRKVIYDDAGWPVHPHTRRRVHSLPIPTSFCLNLVFFFAFPIVALWNLSKGLFKSKSPNASRSDLDMCQCKVDRISQLKNGGVQNSLATKAVNISTSKTS
ncbi:hapless 2-like isoform X2 [Cylas formicarius]|uniref:hapless 2-like isoform X2 n=1 Tax=Cylas formicarius TaxID=197179 RepID=UPI002958B2C4|nr:hapless 2-like isoform X2 [Cylas formicarius]